MKSLTPGQPKVPWALVRKEEPPLRSVKKGSSFWDGVWLYVPKQSRLCFPISSPTLPTSCRETLGQFTRVRCVTLVAHIMVSIQQAWCLLSDSWTWFPWNYKHATLNNAQSVQGTDYFRASGLKQSRLNGNNQRKKNYKSFMHRSQFQTQISILTSNNTDTTMNLYGCNGVNWS